MTNKQQARLKSLIKLSASVRVYVPATVNGNEAYDNTLDVNDTAATLSNLFGGATIYDAVGCWVSPALGFIRERTTIVESHCDTEALELHIDQVLDLAEELKHKLTQESIALEVNNELYLI
jgi:hypothetical protein